MTKEYDKSIHSNPDALAWAKFFMETNIETEKVNEERMHGWFANSMMAMYDHIFNGKVADQTETIAQLKLNNEKLREALSAMLTFFGMDEDENNLEIFKLAKKALGETND